MAEASGNFLYDDVLPRVERIGWLLAITGLVSKYYLFAKADMLLMVGIGTLAVVYFLQTYAPVPTVPATPKLEETSFYLRQGATRLPPPFLGVVATKVISLSSALVLLGILSKLMFWKGATTLLLVGSFSSLIALALLSSVSQFSRIGFTIAILGISLLIIPTETLVRTFYRDDPALVGKMIFQHHHPEDKAAAAEVLRLLHARHSRQPAH